MLNISKNTIQFDFQARTDLATTANGSNINATIFIAFVAQDQTGSKLQIEMSRDKTGTARACNNLWLRIKRIQILWNLLSFTCFIGFFVGMLVRVNEMDMTKKFENASFDFSNQNMFVRWENQTLSASFLQTCEFIFILLMSITIVNEKKVTYSNKRPVGYLAHLNNSSLYHFISFFKTFFHFIFTLYFYGTCKLWTPLGTSVLVRGRDSSDLESTLS